MAETSPASAELAAAYSTSVATTSTAVPATTGLATAATAQKWERQPLAGRPMPRMQR